MKAFQGQNRQHVPALAYCLPALILLTALNGQVRAQHISSTYAFLEVGGKGYVSANVDWAIGGKRRLIAGLTMLDYEYGERKADGSWNGATLPSPGIMLVRLSGKGPGYFELGAGVSVSPMPWKDFSDDDSAVSLHGVIGYRRQRPDGWLFRAGFTPFYRFNWMPLPLVGLSFGWPL